jgi:hypothetical protein
LKCNSSCFIRLFFRASEEAPLPPPPHRAVQGRGEKRIFLSSSQSFGYGYEAVRIRVNMVPASSKLYLVKSLPGSKSKNILSTWFLPAANSI